MQPKLVRLFLLSAGVLLSITAIAKLISASGGARILQTPDPILSVPFRYVFWVVGGIELVVALVCFLGTQVGLRAGLVAWLATGFVAYRIGLLWVGYSKPCSCLGTLTDALHMSPQTADTAMKIVLAYLLIGSYATLFWLWRQHKKATPTPAPA
jgi:hypothetical protein